MADKIRGEMLMELANIMTAVEADSSDPWRYYVESRARAAEKMKYLKRLYLFDFPWEDLSDPPATTND